MKTILTTFLLLFTLISCENLNLVNSSDLITTEVREIGSFNSLKVSSGFKVKLQKGDVEKIEVIANENLHGYIISKIKNKELKVSREDKIKFDRDAEVEIVITYVELNEIDASGGCNITIIDSLSTENLMIDLSGGSRLVGQLNLNNFTADVSGGGRLELNGYCSNFNLDLSGGGKVLGYEFNVDDFYADLSGGASVELTINKTISIDASGGSSLYYKGNAEVISKSLSGGASLVKR